MKRHNLWFGRLVFLAGSLGVACGGSGGEAVGNSGAAIDPGSAPAADAIDLSTATVYNSPPDVASWAVTTAITELEVTTAGIHVAFDKSDGPGRWPDVTPPGWGGPLQYTLWLMLDIDGQWTTSGIVQFWYGLPASGGDVTQSDQIALNWVYDGRWGTMQGHQPAVGEPVGFFVTAGNERGVLDTSEAPVVERSNVVVIPFPATAGASFMFGAAPTAVVDAALPAAPADAGVAPDALLTPPDAAPIAAAGADAIDLSTATVYNSPPDVASWAVTTAITELEVTTAGIHVAFDKSDGPGRWPDVTPPGWGGPLQYTLWLMLDIDGQWTTSGIVQFWYGLPASGGDVTQSDQIALNWVYDGRWGTMQGHQPAVGEPVGFFVTAGNERGVLDTSEAPVVERSNVVVIPFPATAGASFVFGAAPTAVDAGSSGATVDAGSPATTVDAGAPGCGDLGAGSGLAPGQDVASCDARFDLAMQGDGNLVLYFGGQALWSTGTQGNPGASVSMQGDGNLVVYSSVGAALWSSGTGGESGASLALQNDGNLVVHSADDASLWASQTCCH